MGGLGKGPGKELTVPPGWGRIFGNWSCGLEGGMEMESLGELEELFGVPKEGGDSAEVPAGVPAEGAGKRGRKAGGSNHVPYSHDALIDLMIANPGATRVELAKVFGRSSQWIYSVTNSDGFRARYEARREELVDPEIVASVKERFAAIASQSIDVIAKKLTATEDPVLAIKTLEVAAKAAAFGVGTGDGKVQVNNSFVVALPEKAQSADAWAKKYGRVVEVEAETQSKGDENE